VELSTTKGFNKAVSPKEIYQTSRRRRAGWGNSPNGLTREWPGGRGRLFLCSRPFSVSLQHRYQGSNKSGGCPADRLRCVGSPGGRRRYCGPFVPPIRCGGGRAGPLCYSVPAPRFRAVSLSVSSPSRRHPLVGPVVQDELISVGTESRNIYIYILTLEGNRSLLLNRIQSYRWHASGNLNYDMSSTTPAIEFVLVSRLLNSR